MGPASGIAPGWQRLRAGGRGLCYNGDLGIWKGRAADQCFSPTLWCQRAAISQHPCRGSHSPKLSSHPCGSALMPQKPARVTQPQ